MSKFATAAFTSLLCSSNGSVCSKVCKYILLIFEQALLRVVHVILWGTTVFSFGVPRLDIKHRPMWIISGTKFTQFVLFPAGPLQF